MRARRYRVIMQLKPLVCILLSAAPETFTPPAALAFCGFDEDACGWINDFNNWNHRWTQVKQANGDSILCLIRKVVEKSEESLTVREKPPSSWIPISVQKEKQKSKKLVTEDVQARLGSPPIPPELDLRCLTLVYSIQLGNAAALQKLPSLSLLQRQEGYSRTFISSIIHPNERTS